MKRLAVRVRRCLLATQTHEFPRVLSALDELLDLLGTVFEQYRVEDPSAFWLTLGVEEVFTNMIRHNPPSESCISLVLEVDAERISARLTDYDVPPFDVSSVPEFDPTQSVEERNPGGLGVFFVRSKMDEVVYSHDNGNLSVSLTKYREARGD